VAENLQRAGAEVFLDEGTTDFQADYFRIRQALPAFDYYLYLGMDEGSLGTLEAVSAGVKTIVTAQGFHLELPGGITHPFVQFEELFNIFQKFELDHRARAEALSAWSWVNYAKEHLGVWEAMAMHPGHPVPREQLEASRLRRNDPRAELPFTGVKGPAPFHFYVMALRPRRLLGALARLSWMQPFRRLLKR
jgi:hypothetical protein